MEKIRQEEFRAKKAFNRNIVRLTPEELEEITVFKDTAVEDNESKQEIYSALKWLERKYGKRQRSIVEKMIGHDVSPKELGSEFYRTPERINQICKQGLERLKNYFCMKSIPKYLK